MGIMATGEGASSVVDALKAGVTTIASDATSAMTQVVPIALGVAGLVVVLSLGWKAFKRFTK